MLDAAIDAKPYADRYNSQSWDEVLDAVAASGIGKRAQEKWPTVRACQDRVNHLVKWHNGIVAAENRSGAGTVELTAAEDNVLELVAMYVEAKRCSSSSSSSKKPVVSSRKRKTAGEIAADQKAVGAARKLSFRTIERNPQYADDLLSGDDADDAVAAAVAADDGSDAEWNVDDSSKYGKPAAGSTDSKLGRKASLSLAKRKKKQAAEEDASAAASFAELTASTKQLQEQVSAHLLKADAATEQRIRVTAIKEKLLAAQLQKLEQESSVQK